MQSPMNTNITFAWALGAYQRPPTLTNGTKAQQNYNLQGRAKTAQGFGVPSRPLPQALASKTP